MADVWKKWLRNRVGMRVVLALLYGLATFGIPLSHTCKLSHRDLDDQHLEYTSQQLHYESYVEVHHTATFNQNSFSNKADSHDQYCPACLYSLTSKTFRASSNISLCLIQAVTKPQILPQLNFAKEPYWFCSAPLRAPPVINS